MRLWAAAVVLALVYGALIYIAITMPATMVK